MKTPLWYYLFVTSFLFAVVYFYLLRVVEIIDTARDPLCIAVVIISFLGIGVLFAKPPKMASLAVRRVGLILLVIYQVKKLIDGGLKDAVKFKNLEHHVAIVTGGNSGTGLAAAKHLVAMNCNVVLGCRSMDKCNAAVGEILQLYPNKTGLVQAMHLDLNDLSSVKAFADEFQRRYERLDYLINNAGLVSAEGTKTKQGLEESFGAMHIGHFALTKWLLKMLLKPINGNYKTIPAARVVNVASAAYMAGNFHPSLFSNSGAGDLEGEVTDNCPNFGPLNLLSCCPLSACPNTNGYARAKLANVLHAQELQRRFDEHVNATLQNIFPRHYRRLVTASLHPGTVSTNISPLLKYSPSFTRSAEDAGYVIVHALLDDHFVPGSFIDEMTHDHDLSNYRQTHLPMHLAAYPAAEELGFSKVPAFDHFSYHKTVWNALPFISPPSAELMDLSPAEAANLVAARLWDVSEQIIEDWESKKRPFSSEVRESRRSLF